MVKIHSTPSRPFFQRTVKTAITISLVPKARGGPFVYWDGLADACRRAKALGFDAVEIFPESPDQPELAELPALLGQHGLHVAAFGTGAGWLLHGWSLTHPDPLIRLKAGEFIRSIIGLAARFQAPAIIGSMQGRQNEPMPRLECLSLLSGALEDLGAHAASLGQVLLYEPLNRYETNLFNRQADAAAFLSGLKQTNIRLLADLFHMNIEEPSLEEALRSTAGLVGHIHLSDSNRHAAGSGHVDFAGIFSILREIGYKGYLSGEVLPMPDSDAAASRMIDTLRKHAL